MKPVEDMDMMDIVSEVDETPVEKPKAESKTQVDSWGVKTYSKKGELPGAGENSDWIRECKTALKLDHLYHPDKRNEFNDALRNALAKFFRNVNNKRVSAYNPQTHIALPIDALLKMDAKGLKELKESLSPNASDEETQ